MSIYQDVDLAPYASALAAGGQAFNLTLAYNDADGNDYAEVSLSFLDGSFVAIDAPALFTSLNSETPSQSWATRALSGLVPAGAQHVRIALSGSSNGSGTARNISFDNLTAHIGEFVPPPVADIVHGTLVQFNENGVWSWYQDERAIVDTNRGELLVGSIASYGGVGGQTVDGRVQTTHFNLADRSRTVVTHNDIESDGGGDDHNVPAYLKKQDGDVLVFYAAHNRRQGVSGLDDASYYRTLDADTGEWGGESIWHWWPEIPANAPGSGGTTYSNLFQLASEDPDGDGHGRIFNIARTQQSPHIMYSDDNGATWEYGGQFTEAPTAAPSGGNYVNGYYKYWSNGNDRIDVIATEYHPRDFNTSIYHAYVQDGRLYDSQGNVIDADIMDAADSFNTNLVPSTDDFSPVFVSDGVNHSRAWNTDVVRYDDGTVATLFKTRPVAYNNDAYVDTDDHRVWYGRFNPSTQQWATTEIAKAGARLFGYEQDYTGLGALDPDDPNTIFISTEINPITDTPTNQHEIYKGVTADGGMTWTWTAITENSTYDNLRPIVPKWDGENTALIWWRGEKFSHANNDAAVVGIIISSDEATGGTRYVDATPSNTRLSTGGPLTYTTSDGSGATDGSWHLRTNAGNGGTVFTADETASEDAPTIMTVVENVEAGEYDVFAYFWVDEGSDWRVRAGLDADRLPVFRVRGSQHVIGSDFSDGLVSDEANRSLYQAYLGRKLLADGESLVAFINDGDSSGAGRVWYDGIGYALVGNSLLGDFNNDGVVDSADYTVWRDNLGSALALPNEDPLASPGAVTTEDYYTWRDNYGARSFSVEAAAIQAPEPDTMLLLIGFTGAAGRASRSFQQTAHDTGRIEGQATRTGGGRRH